jgi:hypothetical protein
VLNEPVTYNLSLKDQNPRIFQLIMAIIADKKAPWPKWSAEISAFDLYFRLLEIKAENYVDFVVDHKMACYYIMQFLPNNNKNRMEKWFKEPWSPWELLKRIKKQFENKQAKQAARSKLARIRIENA